MTALSHWDMRMQSYWMKTQSVGRSEVFTHLTPYHPVIHSQILKDIYTKNLFIGFGSFNPFSAQETELLLQAQCQGVFRKNLVYIKKSLW